MTEGPNEDAVGRVAAEHLPPILYALEVCAMQMQAAGRAEEATYYRELAGRLAAAAASSGAGDQPADG